VCLAVPGRVVSVPEGELRVARVAFGGVTKEVCLVYVPDASVGDYVIVHVGFAISRLDEAAAELVWSQLSELEGLGDATEEAEP